MRIGIIIQARLGSTRLPNKVLKSIYRDNTVISEIINRAKRVSDVSEIVVATSKDISNNKLENYISSNFSNVRVFRGSENDVLSRFVEICKLYQLDCIVRLTGDNPCIDSSLVESTIISHLEANADYTYTKGAPLGMNVEVIQSTSLYRSQIKDTCDMNKEHVTLYIRNHPEHFILKSIELNFIPTISHLRLTMDTTHDYVMLRILFDYLKKENEFFGIKEIREIFEKHNYVFSVNSHIFQKRNFTSRNEELLEAKSILTELELLQAVAIINEQIDA